MQPDENDIVYNQYGVDLFAIVNKIAEFITGSDASLDGFFAWFYSAWAVYSVIAFIASIIFIIGIIYSYIRYGQLSEEEAAGLAAAEKRWREIHGANQENRRWNEVQQHVASGNPNDWKLAIIEADIILGEVLHEAGYAGKTIGDQLKSASTSNFSSLQDAWDAHLIRNKIAHEGADFVLTQQAAKAAMIKYQRVFKEFGAI